MDTTLQKFYQKDGKLGNIRTILDNFRAFCQVDRRLSSMTVDKHIRCINDYLQDIFGKHGSLKISQEIIRQYLREYINGNPYTYANILKSIRVFHRDFLGHGELVQTFKFPRMPFILKQVPSKEELQVFYSCLHRSKDRAVFLFFAATGLRASEVISLKKTDIDFPTRMVLPRNAHETYNTKKSLISFYNEECQRELEKYLMERGEDNDERLFTFNKRNMEEVFMIASKKSGIKITPQMLREWFCCEMGELSVSDRFVDAFCGRVPKSILARHYTDYSPRKLKVIYDKAGLKVLQPEMQQTEIATPA